jgi:hypothetical protein
MTIEYTSDQFGLICNLLHQAICEQRPEPNLRRNWGSPGRPNGHSLWPSWRTPWACDGGLKCPDCLGYDPEAYWVHDAVWAEAGLEPDGGWLHVACLSRRLGRPLVQADFPVDAPTNEWKPWEDS